MSEPNELFAERHERVRARMREEGLDAVLAYSNAKATGCVRYLSDYFVRFVGNQTRPDGSYYTFGNCAVLFPLEGEPVCVTDQPWDEARAKLLSVFPETYYQADIGADFGHRIAEAGYERVGIDNWFIYPAMHYLAMVEAADATGFVPTMLIEDTYKVKTAAEIELIREAERIAMRACKAGMDAVTVGASEHEFAMAAETVMRTEGDLELAASSIISGGVKTATASGLPTASDSHVMASGDWAMFDICPQFNGYAGDICRMVVAGDLSDVDSYRRRMYDVTLRMNEAAIAAVRPGVTPVELVKIAHDIADEAGFGAEKLPLLGHSVGLDIHDPPDYYYDASPLLEGMCITIEPCMLKPGVAGTRVEDLVLVTADGCEVLSGDLPKTLTANG